MCLNCPNVEEGQLCAQCARRQPKPTEARQSTFVPRESSALIIDQSSPAQKAAWDAAWRTEEMERQERLAKAREAIAAETEAAKAFQPDPTAEAMSDRGFAATIYERLRRR